MPTKPTKGDHGTADRGSQGRGGQKATYGSAVSPEVGAGQAAARRVEDDATGTTERGSAVEEPGEHD